MTTAQIVSKYTNGKPENVSMAIRSNATVNRDFLLYVSQYRDQALSSVNIESIPLENKEFFQTALSSTFHLVFVAAAEPMYGSANVQLVKLNRDGETFRLELYGIQQARSVYELNDANISFGADGLSLMLKSNGPKGLRTLEVKQLPDKKDFNEYTPELPPNPVQLWQLTLTDGDKLVMRYQLVVFRM